MSKPKLALIPSGYKSGKVYSILPNDATGDFDFTRQSIGTRVRKDGLIEEAKTEGSITNIQLYSEQFDNSVWSKVNTSITANDTLAPNGTNTADKLTATASSLSTYVYEQHSLSTSTTYTMSLFVKKGTSNLVRLDLEDFTSGTQGRMTFNLNTQEVTQVVGEARYEELSNGWFRLIVSFTTSATLGIHYLRIWDYETVNGAYFYLWGAMLNEGALSDYIKTEGTTETKTVETFTDVPRLDWLNSNCPSLLLEPQRTNSILQSNDPSGANWTDPLSRWNLLTDTTTAPDGRNVRIIELTESGGSLIRLSGLSISAGTYTVSFYIKDIDGNLSGGSVDIGDEGSGAPTPAFSDVGSDWVRLTRTITTTGTKTYVDLQPSFTGSTNKVAIWGAQVEAGSYATSLIKTEASAVTRLVDSCEVASGLENVINQTEGVFYIEFEYLYETTTDSSTDANRDILVLGTASDISEGISIDNFRSQFRVFIQGSGMTVQSVGNNTAGSSQPNTRYKLAVNYKSGDNKAYLNGSLLGSVQTGNVNFATDLDGIFFSYNSSSRPFKNQKKVYDLRVYDTALTDTELIELTTL